MSKLIKPQELKLEGQTFLYVNYHLAPLEYVTGTKSYHKFEFWSPHLNTRLLLRHKWEDNWSSTSGACYKWQWVSLSLRCSFFCIRAPQRVAGKLSPPKTGNTSPPKWTKVIKMQDHAELSTPKQSTTIKSHYWWEKHVRTVGYLKYIHVSTVDAFVSKSMFSYLNLNDH